MQFARLAGADRAALIAGTVGGLADSTPRIVPVQNGDTTVMRTRAFDKQKLDIKQGRVLLLNQASRL